MRVTALAAMALLFASPRASAADASCGAPARSWIKIERADPGFDESFRTELAAEGFDACRGGGPTAPVATVSVAPSEGGVTIEVVDVVTSKRVSREVDLRSIPPDGRDLALALAADELLHASWAELALTKAPPPSIPVPEPVKRTVETILRPAAVAEPVRSGAIGVVFAGEGFSGGQVQWGADARGQWLVARRFALTVRFGLRSALPKQTPEGEIRGTAVLGGIGGAYGLVASRRVGVDLFARVDAAQITYVADTTIDARATSGSALALLVSGGAEIAWAVLPALRLTGEIGAVAPVRPVRATEAQTTVVVGVSGMGALVGFGAGGIF